ncbi:MAG TPA: hypothetical protein VD928_02720 [Candidatus Paceibacterota bacterium]|nr:hypothetical protein [Candidatus Paceibacterota bacterium]
MQNTTTWVILIIAVMALGAIAYARPYVAPAPSLPGEGEIACTADAMLCPDGSYVGRSGPNCEFVCPESSPQPTSVKVQGRIDQGASALDVKVIPLAVLEDSRCPIDVQCIQAGTVRLQALIVSGLGTSTMTLTLNQSITTEAEQITLTEVAPLPRAGVNISKNQYLFTFEIEKR